MNKNHTPGAVRQFRKTVYDHFRKHGRRLPWRRNHHPYQVFVSEVMLQQTQVDRVAEKFGPFIKALPDFDALAQAPLSRVLSLWQGLGYNRRALHLKRAGEIIVQKYKGVIPSSPDILETLPGIGKATAASIAAFAFDRPAVFLETNIRSVLIHHFFTDTRPVHDRELLPLAAAVLDRKNPRKWYSALMDYGTMLKKKHGNEARRSAHYKKQGRFEGSNRQIRGRMIRMLLEKKSVTSEELSQTLGIPSKLLNKISTALLRDGMISRVKNRYSFTL